VGFGSGIKRDLGSASPARQYCYYIVHKEFGSNWPEKKTALIGVAVGASVPMECAIC
jgi:hypothetical protein